MTRHAMLLFAIAVGSACGGGSPTTPTPQHGQTTETVTGTPFRAQAAWCQDFYNAIQGAVSVTITPPSAHLSLGAGSCATPGATLAEGTGEVRGNAPAGGNHVRVSNRSDASFDGFTLSITRWY